VADTADVIIFNLLDKEMDFVNCQTNESGTIGVFPRTIPPQQVGRFFINTTRIAQTVSGDCWWSIPGATNDCKRLPSGVGTCPWIHWDKTAFCVGTTCTENIEWDVETPGEFGIGDVTITKRLNHQSKQYCICPPETNLNDCQKRCVEL